MAVSWTKKHGKSYFGYKLSANTDKKYKLIRKIKISTPEEHDILHLEAVLDGNTSHTLYADKGYVDRKREARLKAKGWQVCIQRKAARTKAYRLARNVAIDGLPKHVPMLSMSSPVWSSRAVKGFAVLAWQEPPCN